MSKDFIHDNADSRAEAQDRKNELKKKRDEAELREVGYPSDADQAQACVDAFKPLADAARTLLEYYQQITVKGDGASDIRLHTQKNNFAIVLEQDNDTIVVPLIACTNLIKALTVLRDAALDELAKSRLDADIANPDDHAATLAARMSAGDDRGMGETLAKMNVQLNDEYRREHGLIEKRNAEEAADDEARPERHDGGTI